MKMSKVDPILVFFGALFLLMVTLGLIYEYHESKIAYYELDNGVTCNRSLDGAQRTSFEECSDGKIYNDVESYKIVMKE